MGLRFDTPCTRGGPRQRSILARMSSRTADARFHPLERRSVMPTVTWEDVLRSVTQTQGVTNSDLPSAFPINVSVDALLAERVTRLNDEFEDATTPPHNPVLVEPLLE